MKWARFIGLYEENVNGIYSADVYSLLSNFSNTATWQTYSRLTPYNCNNNTMQHSTNYFYIKYTYRSTTVVMSVHSDLQ